MRTPSHVLFRTGIQSQIGEKDDSFSVTNESEVSFMDQDELLFLTLNND